VWDSAAVVLPVFGLIGVGYGARALGAVSDRAGEGVSEFVFTLAVPCLIFRTLSRAEFPAVQPWGYWLSYFLGVAAVWAVAMALAIRVFRVTGSAAVVAGFTAGQSNTVFVGVPMILKAYGDEGAVPLFLLIAVHLPVVVLAGHLDGRGTERRPGDPPPAGRRQPDHPGDSWSARPRGRWPRPFRNRSGAWWRCWAPPPSPAP
jgi:predicted permease